MLRRSTLNGAMKSLQIPPACYTFPKATKRGRCCVTFAKNVAGVAESSSAHIFPNALVGTFQSVSEMSVYVRMKIYACIFHQNLHLFLQKKM